MNAIETLRTLTWGDRFKYNGREYTLAVGHGEGGAYGTGRTSWDDVDRGAETQEALFGPGVRRVHVIGATGYSNWITVRPEKSIEILPRTIPQGV